MGSLAATVGMLIAQDTAAQVYRSTVTPFFLLGFGYAAVFAVIWVVPWGRGEDRAGGAGRLSAPAGLWAAAMPAGTFLAGLAPWAALPHPAAVLYSLAAGLGGGRGGHRPGRAVAARSARRGPGRGRHRRSDRAGHDDRVAPARDTPFGLSALTAGPVLRPRQRRRR